MEKGKQASEVETLIVRNIIGGAPDNGIPVGTNTEPHPLMMEVVPEWKRLLRPKLISIGNSYFMGLDTDQDWEECSF